MREANRPGRLHAVDAARGAAVVGMVVFHGAWDLHAYGLISIDPSAAPAWQLFGHAVACSFLFLSGLSLVLAQRRGSSRRSAVRRLLTVAAAAAVVTVVTWIAMPDRVILFGILHCIVVGDAVALLFLNAPALPVLGLAALASVLPLVLRGALPESLWFVGLSANEPQTLDMRPILPWIAPILIGVVVGRFSNGGRALTSQAHPAVRPLEFIGRHSLAAYLIHQPVLLAFLAAATGVVVPPQASTGEPDTTAAFLQQCENTCHAAKTDLNVCRSACRCALTAALKTTDPEAPDIARSCAAPSSRSTGGGR